MGKDIFELATYAREHVNSPEYQAFLLKSKEEAMRNEILRDYAPQQWWFEKPVPYNDHNVGDAPLGWQDMQLNRVIGVDHPTYNDCETWLEILVRLAGTLFPKDKQKAREILHKYKDELSFSAKDDNFYIRDGHHRITYAKFLNNDGTLTCKCIS